mgnify:CR=1 FL=1
MENFRNEIQKGYDLFMKKDSHSNNNSENLTLIRQIERTLKSDKKGEIEELLSYYKQVLPKNEPNFFFK